MLILSIRTNLNQVERDLNRMEREQLPFASAQAATALAGLVQNAERQEMRSTFDGVTPFTLGGVKVKRARKSDPTAVVYLGDISEAYLAPYISGGRHFLGSKRGLLNPKGINVNQYGNIPKGKLAALKAKPNVFVGTIKTKNGQTIGGVFQRGNFTKRVKRTPGVKPIGKAVTSRHRLRILIRFTDPERVTQRLPWYETARQVLDAHANREIDLAVKAAMATARP